MNHNQFENLKYYEVPKKDSSSTLTQPSKASTPESEARDTNEPSLVQTQTKPRRGRPSKASKTPVTSQEKCHCSTVTYLKPGTKELLQKIKAMIFLESGQNLSEDAIVRDALNCFVKTNNYKIK